MKRALVLSFIVAAALLVISPGPNGVLLARTVPTSGRAAGLANVAGFIAAFYLHGALSIFGISIILVQSAEAFFVFKMLGAIYLCWLGGKALYEAWKGGQAAVNVVPARRRRSLTAAFFQGFLTNALNPKVSMFYLAAFPQFMSGNESVFEAAFLLVSIHAAINAIWFSLFIFLFGRLKNVASTGAFQRWLKGITGVVFMGFGAKLATLEP